MTDIIHTEAIPQGYHYTNAGVLPNEWESRPLSSVVEEIAETAGARKIETVSISAGIGFVNQAEKFGKELSGKQYEKYTVLHQGDFSYNKGNSNLYPQGCIYRLNDREEAAVPNVFESFRVSDGNPDYYEQLFVSGFLNKQLYSKINHGVRDDGLLNLRGKDFFSCEVPCPPIAEQEKIAEILAHCDKMISLCQSKIDELSKQKKYFLKEMFPQQGSNVPNIRFPGFTAPWEQRKLGDVCESFEYGLNASAKDYDGENKYIRITDIDDNSHKFLQEKITSPNIDLTNAENYRLRQGDILFARTGASVGKTYIYKAVDGVVYYAGFLIRGRVKNEYSSEFIFQNTLTVDYDKYIRIISQRSGQPGVNAQEYARYEICTPTYEEQEKIGKFFNKFDNLITLHQRELSERKRYKKALMQLLLTGIVRTNNGK